MSRFFFFLFCSFSSLMVFCQVRDFRGTVADASGMPLSAVTVSANDEQRSIVSFTHTDAKGFYLLPLDSSLVSCISFSCIGYKTSSLSCDQLSRRPDVILQEDSCAIPEVTVVGSPILVHGDTVSYRMSSFMTQHDRTVSDVLRKMPGIAVSSDGSIQYQGKDISTVYVEGLDLTGGRYVQVTENLSADKVGSVQVYENHQQVRSLRDVSHSDRAALNLTLKDGDKGATQWLVDLSAGHSLQSGAVGVTGSARLMQMRFLPRYQQMNFYKNDFLGRDIYSEVRSFGDTPSGIESSLLSSVVTSVQGIDAERYDDNRSHLLSSNTLWKMPNGAISRLQAIAYVSDLHASQQILTDYFIGDTIIGISEYHDARQRHREFFVEHKYSDNGDVSLFENTLQVYGDFDEESSVSRRNGSDASQEVSPRQYYLRDVFRSVRPVSVGRYVVNASFSLNHLPGKLLVAGSHTQRLSQDVLYGFFDVTRIRPLGPLMLTWKTGFNSSCGLYSLSMDTLVFRSDSYSFAHFYTSPGLSFKSDRLRFSVSLPFNVYSYGHLSDSLSSVRFFMSPVIFADWHFSASWRATLTSRYTMLKHAFTDLWEQPYYTSYMSLVTGSGRKSDEKLFSGFFSLQYHDVLSGLFGHLSCSCQGKSGEALSDYAVSDAGIVSYRLSGMSGSSWNVGFSGSLSKSFVRAGLNISVKASYNRGFSDRLSSGAIVSSRFTAHSLGCSLAFSPVEWFGIDLQGQYASQHRCLGDGVDVLVRSFRGSYGFFLLLNTFQFDVSASQYVNRLPEKSSAYFVDASICYKRKPLEIGLYARNLTGLRRYSVVSLSEQYATNSETVLRPREFYVKFSFAL